MKRNDLQYILRALMILLAVAMVFVSAGCEKGPGRGESVSNYVRVEETAVVVKASYSEKEDIVIKIGPGGGNNIPDIRGVYAVDSDGVLNSDTNNARTIVYNYTDIIGPHVVAAVNNADGDEPDSGYFTGGNHQSNNSGTGGAVTARYEAFEVLCDGIPVSDEAYGNEVTVSWTNYIRGYNTSKADGNGREILKEVVTLRIQGATVYVDIRHEALEDVVRETYYGIQMISAAYGNVEYVGGEDPGVHAYNSYSDCGNYSCRTMRLTGENGDVLEMGVFKTGLGDFKWNNSGYSAFNKPFGKCYFNLIEQTEFLQKAGETTTVSGYYHFMCEDALPQ